MHRQAPMNTAKVIRQRRVDPTAIDILRCASVIVVFGLALLPAPPAGAAATASVVETRSVSAEAPTGTPGATHELRLTLYTFQGTRWQPGDIVMAIWEAVGLLDQCG